MIVIWNSLENIIIGNKCCVKTDCFKIISCPRLKSIEIGESSFSYYGELFELVDLPALQSIKIGTLGKESNNFMFSPLELKGLESVLR